MAFFINTIIKAISNIDPKDFIIQDPPPPQRHFNFEQESENEEEKRFRKVFQQLAGDDLEVSPNELKDILNRVVTKHGGLKTDGFSIESCRSMVAVMDRDSTGKLGFHEFKTLWNNIKKWQAVYLKHDCDSRGVISQRDLPATFRDAGFPLNDQLCNLIYRRYSDEHGDMDFDNFIGCMVRLNAMCSAFSTLDRDNSGSIELDIKEWLQLTMYS